MNPFDHIKNLHTKQRSWDDFNDEEKKSFNIFIINKALSMNPNYLDIVNMVQRYTNNMLNPKEVFNLYFNLLPNKFRFYKWIKGIKDKNKEKYQILSQHFECSSREAKDYMELLDKKEVNKILKLYKNGIQSSKKTLPSSKK
jgi:hypothetical protein